MGITFRAFKGFGNLKSHRAHSMYVYIGSKLKTQSTTRGYIYFPGRGH